MLVDEDGFEMKYVPKDMINKTDDKKRKGTEGGDSRQSGYIYLKKSHDHPKESNLSG
jgi:hypothetical protein